MAVKESEVIGKSEALAILKAGREQPKPEADKPDPVTEAARTLGKRAAEARQAASQQPPVKEKADTAPEREKPEEEAPDNSEEIAEPEGQDATEEQAEESKAGDDGWVGDGDDAIITLDGQKITKQELRDSYLRRDDYTRKTQHLAERSKVLDQALGVVTQNSQRSEQLIGLLEQALGQEPDWGTLAMQMQPQQYLAYKENWNQQRQVLNNARAEHRRATETAIQTAKTAMFEEAARTFRPDWQDQAKRQAGITELANFAISEGITPEELQMLHRTPMLKILSDAMELKQIKASQRITDKKVQHKPKPVRPGTQPNRQSAAEAQLETARQNWESNKRPTTKDAMSWLRAKESYEAATGRRVG